MTFVLDILLVIGIIFCSAVFFGAPYVPSQKFYVNQALTELYHLKPSDVLVDLGSGDGLVLRSAAELGAHAIGYEINPILVIVSQLLSYRYRHLVKTRLANSFITPLPKDTTVVYLFSVTRDMTRTARKLQNDVNRLGRPINVICYGIGFKNKTAIKKVGAYYLYTLQPLQLLKAQV